MTKATSLDIASLDQADTDSAILAGESLCTGRALSAATLFHASGGSDAAKKPIWQSEFFDHLIRSNESYDQKSEFVRGKSVRAGFVSTADAWKYAGEIELFFSEIHRNKLSTSFGVFRKDSSDYVIRRSDKFSAGLPEPQRLELEGPPLSAIILEVLGRTAA